MCCASPWRPAASWSRLTTATTPCWRLTSGLGGEELLCAAWQTFDSSVTRAPLFHCSSQQSWASVIVSSLLILRQQLERGSKVPGLQDIAVNPVPLLRESLHAMRVLDFNSYRLHVKVKAWEQEVCYRLDTRDMLEVVENSILCGGETLVLERRLSPTEWALPSVKGDRLWSDVEVRCLLA